MLKIKVMVEDIKTVEIELCEVNNEDCLKFTFVDKLIEKDAIEGVKEWEDIFSSVDINEKTTIIWDSTHMTGFENKARIIWQKTIKKLKQQIKTVWLITDSKTIHAGAKLMSLFTSFEIKVVKLEEEIV